jgi:DNA recombination protein RmuC
MELAAGLIIGFLLGGGIAYWLGRRSTSDAAAIAEGLTDRIFSQQAEKILQLAETKLSGKKEIIDGTLQAMKSDLKRVEELMRKVGDGNVQVGTRLDNAATAIKELSETTGGIRNALSSNSLRGQWGERMAEDVLRLSGLLEGINFIKQATLGTGSKPDFTFLLPQKRRLNMDVKFPFNNYQLYLDAKTDKEKEEAKDKFIKDVRKRLKEVQTRDYINPEDGTVDYVLLFVPNEQIFSFINEMDRTLVDEAMRGKTILCSPLSLYAILAVIRQSIDNFSMESKSQEMLSAFGAFKMQWDKYKDQMETVKERFESVHKGYEELTGTRERQLDRQLQKIEEIRIDRGIEAPPLQEVIDNAKLKSTRKLIASEA